MGLRDLLVGIGFLLLFEGLPLFAAPHFYRRITRQLEDIPDRFLRIAGVLAALSGMIILYAVFFGLVD